MYFSRNAYFYSLCHKLNILMLICNTGNKQGSSPKCQIWLFFVVKDFQKYFIKIFLLADYACIYLWNRLLKKKSVIFIAGFKLTIIFLPWTMFLDLVSTVTPFQFCFFLRIPYLLASFSHHSSLFVICTYYI